MSPPVLDLSKGGGLGVCTYMLSTQEQREAHEEGMTHGLMAHTGVVDI